MGRIGYTDYRCPSDGVTSLVVNDKSLNYKS